MFVGKRGVLLDKTRLDGGMSTITRQGVKLRELFSRRKMVRGRGFARTWRERMTRAICLE